jgi:hypothetical protein
MTSRLAVLSLALCLPLGLTACLDAEKGEESELPIDGEADSFRTPTNHGFIGFGAGEASAITDAEQYHAWTFSLSAPASIETFTTYAIRGQRRTDTVLYLYKQQANGNWGSYIARNDDYGDTTYSRIRKDLQAGNYRVLVKGYAETTRGKFKVQVDCTGAGCVAAPDPNACVFGTAYNELDQQEALVVNNRVKWTAATPLSTLDQRRVVLAVQQSSHTDVTTAAEAFARVDQNEINAVFVYEPEAARSFLVLEYGAGDNSYGAYFEGLSDVIVASIHDGDLLGCETKAERCLLGHDYYEMRNDAGYTRLSARVVTDAAQLSAEETAQAMIAFEHAFDGYATSVADGLVLADNNELNVVQYMRTGTGARFHVIEFGAGDTSLGAVFYGDSTDLAAVIDDTTFYACSFFIER